MECTGQLFFSCPFFLFSFLFFRLVGSQSNDIQCSWFHHVSLCLISFRFFGFQADEPSEDPSLMEDYARTAIPEEGFKGNSPFICLSHRLFVLTIFVSTRSQELNSSVAESHPASNRQVPKKKNKQTHTQKFSCCDVCLSLSLSLS